MWKADKIAASSKNWHYINSFGTMKITGVDWQQTCEWGETHNMGKTTEYQNLTKNQRM